MSSAFKNKTVLITGASKGIGLGIAKAFIKEGANIAIIARHNDRTVINQLSEAGTGDVHFFTGDVTSGLSITEAIQEAAEFFHGIDIVCANAGIFPTTPLESISEEEWGQVLDTNARGTFLLVQKSLSYLKKSTGGRIVITSSITGPLTGYKGFSHYGASKAAQLGFMRSAALELAAYQITINAVMPGNVLTEGLVNLGEDYLKKMADSVPLKRLGSPDDIAQAVLFLASEKASYITGQTLVVDGGQTLPENLDGI
ncbi:MAG: 3-oxoacyl-ACP reductase FabG [Sporolactobacillus sp.]